MLKNCKIILLSISLGALANATDIDDIKRRGPYYLSKVFDRDLYDLDGANTYDPEYDILLKRLNKGLNCSSSSTLRSFRREFSSMSSLIGKGMPKDRVKPLGTQIRLLKP